MRGLPRNVVCLLCAALWPVGLAAPSEALGQSVGLDTPELQTPLDSPAPLLEQAGVLIHLPQLISKYPTLTGSGYTVAILDTGVDYTHPALAGRYVGGTDIINNDDDPQDDNGHGTHVAGIAASDDPVYRGMAPGAGIAAVKVLNSAGSATWGQIEAGLQWVVAHREEYNIVAVNLSLGTSTIYNKDTNSFVTDELAALKDAGVFIAAASGNGWYGHSPTQGVVYPAADPSTVSVGAVFSADFGPMTWSSGAIDYTSGTDRIVSFTDRSTTMLDILAPGAVITSANCDWEGDQPDWTDKSGTSMATPVVAGLALLMREAIETYWPESMRPQGADMQDTILRIMQETGTPCYDGDDENDNVANLNYTFYRVDALAAIDAISAVPEPATLTLLWAGAAAVIVRGRKSRRRPS